ncbi:hypothetical protein NJ7G_3789 [Natrinema sp. J7-2]|nr:hypothetical protein NJ7G_3789 [Natrinema sp. J7-2]
MTASSIESCRSLRSLAEGLGRTTPEPIARRGMRASAGQRQSRTGGPYRRPN